jgi:glycine/D-amino acid oxidase-like deaminating enzyme
VNRNPLDCLIVGQGLAGTTLAHQARAAGLDVAVVDRGDSDTASRAAAGLVTPVTGKRVVKSWRLDALLPAAVAFYRRIEVAIGDRVYFQTPMVRLFAADRERAVYESRAETEFRGLTREPDPPLNPDWLSGRLDGFEMPTTGRLDVPRYLDLSRAVFERDGSFLRTGLGPADLVFDAELVRVPSLELSTRRVVFCTGFDRGANLWFRHVPFNAAKGEILTLRVPGFEETRVVNRGIWLAPVGDGLFHAGATYEWDDLMPTPTAAGRTKLETRLRTLVKVPFEVVGHRAGIRPISADRNPILGFHPAEPRIGVFTGLGSKGVLHAPFFANQLVGAMTGTGEIDPEVNVNRFLVEYLRGGRN